MNFKIRNDFVLRYRRHSYTYSELAQAVSYWLNHIQQIPDTTPIGVAYCQLSFSATALILALYKSGRAFTHLGGHSLKLNHDTRQEFNLSHVYVVGATEEDPHFYRIPFDFTRTDAWQHAWAMSQWPGREDLVIPFTAEQQITCYTGGTTGRQKPVRMSAELEAISIKLAQDLFFVADDYCVFQHSMGHPGVHTTALLPGLFTARCVSLADVTTWSEEILRATHVQYFYTMLNFLDLPPRLRMITTGGSMLKPVYLETVKSQCDFDNLYDIYGLTECLPPLAVRKIQDPADLDQPFVWVNHDYQFETVVDKLKITRPDGMVILPDDRGIRINNQLQFFGRSSDSQQVRVRGQLTSFQEFRQEFEQQTGIVQYVLQQHQGSPRLLALDQDRAQVEQFVLDCQVELDVEYFDRLNTSGGIKNIV